MGFLFSGVFWGVVLCLLGVSMIVKVVFHVDIPVFRIVLAGVLILLGVRMLLGTPFSNGRVGNVVAFGQGDLKPGERGDHAVVFGRGVLDLVGVRPADRAGPVEFTTVFGEGVVRLDPTVPARVTLSSAFAGARMPDGTEIAFGSHVYRTPGQVDDAPFLDVRVTVVFGSLTVERAEAAAPANPTPGI